MRFILFSISAMFISGCSKSWYAGEWTVSDVQFPAISALSAEEARVWFGSEAIYSASHFSFRDESCEVPQFEFEMLVESEFRIHYRASFSQLGIEGETAEIMRMTCDGASTFPGSTFIKATADTAYIPWDGAFFRLDRNVQ